MSKQFETGHTINAANLLKYNQFLTTLGVAYNPPMTSINMAAMNALYASCQAQLDLVKQAEENWKTKTNNREIAFGELSTFSTRLLGVLRSTDAPQQTLDDMAALVGKVRGSRKKTKPVTETPPDASAKATEEAVSHSTSQQSYDHRLDNFSRMVVLLQGVSGYTPNEPDLSITGLQNRLVQLTTLNGDATAASIDLKLARRNRDAVFYAPNTGMIDLVSKSKAYVLGLYGRASREYKTAVGFKLLRSPQ